MKTIVRLLFVVIILFIFIGQASAVSINILPNSSENIGYRGVLTTESIYADGMNISDIWTNDILSSVNLNEMSTYGDNLYVSKAGGLSLDEYIYVNFSVPNVLNVNSINITSNSTIAAADTTQLGFLNYTNNRWMTVNSSAVAGWKNLTYNLTTNISNYINISNGILKFSISMWSNGNPFSTINIDYLSVVVNYVPDYNISVCQNITQPGNYNIIGDLNSPTSCLGILSDNVSLNGNGKTINYSQTSGGYGVSIINYSYFTLNNISIIQGIASSEGYAVNLQTSNNNTLSNVSINTIGHRSNGIRIISSKNISLKNNNINTTVSEAIWIMSTVADAIYYNHSIDESNTAHGKPIRYLFNVSNMIIKDNSSLGMLYVTASNNITVTNITISNADNIGLGMINNSNISYNNISNFSSRGGIKAYPYNYNNTISYNSISSASYYSFGFYLDSGSLLNTSYEYNTFSNNNINMSGDNGYCFYFVVSGNNIINNTICKTYGLSGHGVVLLNSDNNIFINNSDLTYGADSYGFYTYGSNNNNVTNDTIISVQSYDIFLQDFTNNFRNINLTQPRKILFFNSKTNFNYSNISDYNIWMNTNTSSQTYLTRSINKWSNTDMQWNETNHINGTVYYLFYNMLPTRNYLISTNSSSQYIKTTDNNGMLQFNLTIFGETIITLQHIGITIPANSWGIFNNWSKNTNFSSIAINESNDVAYTFYNVTSGEWDSYYPGYSWNADQSIDKNNSILGFFNAETTITANTVTPWNTTITAGWNMLYLMGTSNQTLTAICTNMVNCTDIYYFNSTTNDYVSTGTDTIQPNQGFLAYVNQTGTWIRSTI